MLGVPNIVAMFVCSCRALTDRTIDAAIAGGAKTLEDLAARCGAGVDCGGCRPELSRRLREQTSDNGGKKHRAA